MKYKQSDISKQITIFLSERTDNKRYSSFDYCYNYFYKTKPEKIMSDIEKSCLVLGFYLASWGMYRGSAFLLQKSVKTFIPLIEYVSTLDESIWQIDVADYIKKVDHILDVYDNVRRLLFTENKSSAHVTLVTKIMLGVFGVVPAFDRFFSNTFKGVFNEGENKCGFSVFNSKSLQCISRFYLDNQSEIDQLASLTKTIDFLTGKETNIHYPKIKIIDMYGFQKSFG